MLASSHHGTLYMGVTSNLVGRGVQHGAGDSAGFTRTHAIRRLVWHDVAETMEAAILRGKQIKRRLRDRKITSIE